MSRYSPGDNSDYEMASPTLRPIRRLPSTLHSYKFTQYRSVSNVTSSDEGDTETSDIEPELGSGCDEVESLMEIDSVTASPSPHAGPNGGDGRSRKRSPTLTNDEGEEVDISLSCRGTMSPSPAPGLDVEMMWGGEKGKGRMMGEGPSVMRIKRQRLESDDECEADDEAQVIRMTRVFKKAKQTLGPTRSILEITHRVHKLGRKLSYANEDDDAIIVSSSLPSIPISPTHASTYAASGSRPICALPRASQQSTRPRRIPARRQLRRPVSYRRPATSGSSSGSETEKMITSDVERELERIDNEVQRRRSVRQYPVRLPGQFTSAKLRRFSPTSLLPSREKRSHLKVAAKEHHVRGQIKGRYGHPRVVVGQLLLAAGHDDSEARKNRRNAVYSFNKRLDKVELVRSLLPSVEVVVPKPVDLFEDVEVVRQTHRQREMGLFRRRVLRDKRRVYADRRVRDAEPCSLPPPTISPSFRSITINSPASQSLPIPHLIDAPFAPVLEVEEEQSDASDPPEYEEPPMPIRIPLPRHLRARPAPRPPSNEVPDYVAREYSRRSPPPPPPFNAQTDDEVLIAARFIDDDDEEPEFIHRPMMHRGRGVHLSSPARQSSPEAEMVGAFPQPVAVPAPIIVAPIPVRPIEIDPIRNSWEAALELEEGDEDVDDMEALLGVGNDDEDQEEVENGGALATIGRLVRRVWGW